MPKKLKQFFSGCPTVCYFKKDNMEYYFLQHTPRKRTIVFWNRYNRIDAQEIELPYVIYNFVKHKNEIVNFKIMFSDIPIEKEDDLKRTYLLNFPNIEGGIVCFGNFTFDVGSNFDKDSINKHIGYLWHTPFSSNPTCFTKTYHYQNIILFRKMSIRDFLCE